MKTRNSTLFLVSAVLLTGFASSAMADSLSEVAGARANARAGGPTNDHDAELLRRYGGLSEGRGNYYGSGYPRYQDEASAERRYRRRATRYDNYGYYND
jgi:hypothetical protein